LISFIGKTILAAHQGQLLTLDFLHTDAQLVEADEVLLFASGFDVLAGL